MKILEDRYKLNSHELLRAISCDSKFFINYESRTNNVFFKVENEKAVNTRIFTKKFSNRKKILYYIVTYGHKFVP